MRKRKWLLAAVPLILLSLSAAYAGTGGGLKVGAPDVDATINVPDDTHIAYSGSGALGTVRSEPYKGLTQNKQIGCQLDAAPDGMIATCQVSLDDVTILRCVSTDQNIINAVASINGDSMVSFWTATQPLDPGSADLCMEVLVENASQYLPKAP